MRVFTSAAGANAQPSLPLLSFFRYPYLVAAHELVGSHPVIRRFGHGLAGMAVAQGLASQEKTPNKAVLMASAAQYLTAPVMMAIQKDDFKPEMIAVNGALCLGMGALCLKAAKDN